MTARSRTISPGTYVRFRGAAARWGIGVITSHEGADLYIAQTDAADRAACCRDDFSVLRHQPAEPLRFRRQVLPYGVWTCGDGRQVLFNRDYEPIWQRRPGEKAVAADEDEFVGFVRQEWFYDDGNRPVDCRQSDERCQRVLAEWGVPATGLQQRWKGPASKTRSDQPKTITDVQEGR